MGESDWVCHECGGNTSSVWQSDDCRKPSCPLREWLDKKEARET